MKTTMLYGPRVATPGILSDDLIPSLLSASDVLGTGWFGATDIVTERGDEGVAKIKVFDLTLPLKQVAEGYRAMDQRRAIKALLRP